jgi:signal transduction histidine kinase
MADKALTKEGSAIKKTTDSQTHSSDSETIDLHLLFHSISESLGVGLIIFDHNLEIRHSTALAGRLLELNTRIDQSLACDVDSKTDWKTLLETAMENGEISRVEAVRVINKGKNRLLNLTCIPIRTPEGAVSCGTIILEDITEKVGRENELSHTERLITMGKVAGKVAHELNNPMDGILRYLNLAMRILEHGDIDKAQEYLRQSRTGLMRMVHILSELLEFSRSSSQAMEPAPLDKIVQDALAATTSALNGIEVQILKKYEGQTIQMRNDSLFQVFCNLIKNACDAMQGQGKLTVTIEKINTDWQISFLDTGPGIPPESRSLIFQPFFTTKTGSKGVGLGLAICKDLLEKHKGTISVHCPDEGGSLFIVRLPASAGITINSE